MTSPSRLARLVALLSKITHTLSLILQHSAVYATCAFALVIAINAVAFWINPRESLLFLFWSSPSTLTALSALAASFGLLLCARGQRPSLRFALLLLAPATLHALADAAFIWNHALTSPKLTLHSFGWFPSSLLLAIFLIAPTSLPTRSSTLPKLSSIRSKLTASLGAACILFLFPLHLVLSAGGTDYQRTASTAVVLGARAYPDGSLSDALRDRVHTSVTLYKKRHVKRLLMTGGFSAGNTSEPRVMRAYAVRNGVPKKAIILDEEGHNTAASIRNLKHLHRTHNLGTLLVVSHDHHTLRLRVSCHRLGLTCFTVPAKQEQRLLKEPYFILREVAGLLYYSLTFRAL